LRAVKLYLKVLPHIALTYTTSTNLGDVRLLAPLVLYLSIKQMKTSAKSSPVNQTNPNSNHTSPIHIGPSFEKIYV